jgi:RNA-dependent RNA polymerase
MSEIVSTFKPPPPNPPPSGFLNKYFEKDVETVLDFCTQHRGESRDHLAEEIRKILLSNLSNTRVGVYSKFHDNATYNLGYDNQTTIRLAYMYEFPFPHFLTSSNQLNTP